MRFNGSTATLDRGRVARDEDIPKSDFDLFNHVVRDKRGYSLSRAMASVTIEKQRPDGLEGEVHDALSARGHKSSGGFLWPWWAPVARSAERRGLDTGAGAGTIATVIPPMTLLDILRHRLVFPLLGA